MSSQAYSIEMPRNWDCPVILASPHSGANYAHAFIKRSVLDPKRLRSSEDAFVDRLLSAGPDLGMPLISAKKPRAYLDLNRSCEELDPALIEGVARRGQNPRIASGLGVIPRVVAHGRAIYSGKLSLAEAQARIDTVWHPYHSALQQLLDSSRTAFGETILLDCHSMPHEAIEGLARMRQDRPQIVLGDRFGASAKAEIVDHVEAAFVGAGFRVARNSPFAGAYITQTYGRPVRRQHAIQVEIDRSLYMNEAEVTPNAQFEDVKAALTQALAEIARGSSCAQRMAAE